MRRPHREEELSVKGTRDRRGRGLPMPSEKVLEEGSCDGL